jgi:hypothetical protein
LNRFFEKNPAKRITWDELIDHPFWEGLPKLQKISLPHQELFETLILSDRYLFIHVFSLSIISVQSHVFWHSRSPTKEINTRQSIKEESALTSGQDQEDIDSEDTASCETRSNKSSTEQIDYDEHEKEFDHNEQLISVKNKQELDMGIAQQKIVRPASAPVDVNSREVSTKVMKTLAEQLAPKGDCIVGKESNNEISENSEMLRLAAGSKKETYLPQTAPSRGTITISSARGSSSLAQGRPGLTKCSRRFGLRSASKLIYGSAFDCVVKPIVYSEDIELIAPLRVKMELLGFDGMSVHDLVRCKSDLLEGHLKKLYHALKSSNTTDASKLNLLAYLFGLSIHSKLANVIINSSMFLLLVKMLKQSADDAASLTESQLHESSCQSLLSRVCLVLGVLIRFATFISPSSPTQIPAIVKLLSQVVNDHSSQTMMHQRQQQNDEEMDEMEDPAVRMRIRIRSRALSCLGELLFYLSSQKNWQFSSSGTAPGVQSILRSLDDRDEVARHYATRTICNLLLQCHDQDLLVHIVNEQVTLSLLNGFSRCCNSSNVSVALRTTTAQALSQVLRHASSGAIAIGSSSRVLQSNLMKLLCRQNFLELLWCGGVETGEQNDCSLAIACMNILNGFLDFNEDTTQGSLHFDQKKSQLLEKIAAFPAMLRILEKKSVYEDVTRHSSSISLNSITHGNKYSERSKKDSSTPLSEEANPGAKSSSNNVANVLRAKTLLFLYFGMQLSRSFAIQSISKQLLNSVEKILITYSSHLRSGSAGVERDDEDNEDPLEMTNTRLTSIDVYVLQCALNLIKLSIRTALKLSTDIVQEFHEENLPSGTQHISFDAPFKLYSLLLKNPMCKMQLIHFFVGNERKEYRFFVRIMAKLLLLRKSEAKNQTSPFALPVSDILLDLYDPKNNESGNTLDEDGGSSNSWNYSSLFNVEIESVLQYLLPSIMKQLDIAMVTSSASTVSEGSKGEDESIAVNCIRVMYSFLLHVGFTADTTVMISITDAGEEHNIDIASARVRFLTEHFFVRLPKLFHVEHPNENVWRFLVELLYGLVSHQERDEQSFIEACISSVSSSPKSPYPKNLLWSVIALLRTPSQENFHAFPSSVTKLVKLVVEHIFQIWSPTETLEKIFQCQMGKSIMSVLEFGHAQLLLTSCKVDLLEILYHVLYSRYEILKKANGLLVSPVGGDFDQLVQSAQFLLKLCSLSSSSIEDPTENEEVADLASRCLMFMGQVSIIHSTE